MPSAAEPAGPLIDLEGKKIPDQVDQIALLRDRLVVAVRSVCPYWLRDQQQDIVQVAMIAVLKQKEGNRQFPASYLRKAAFTAMVDEIRRRRSRGEVPLEAEDDDEPTLVAASAGPERRLMSGEISVEIRACLDRLASPRRSAVTFHLLAYKVPSIAEKMGWKRKQAENLVYRGMQDLRECLRRKGLQP